EQAFHQILKLKQRPIEKGVILLAAHISQVEHLLQDLTTEMREQVIESWSNDRPAERAITWLLPPHQEIPAWIKGDHLKVAVRVFKHPLCMALCQAFGGFIVDTSVNSVALDIAR